ncbi:deoxyribodipyrimidine photo-lyase [Azoarcus communis]|uniref:Deoxyribodipyrimidine photo-lyase n=1 Tax=Parazoarcus communis SWub3 = DSM 12120 TaxID=1121029 RepID=A0A323UV01_9RHOO|nr:deoxyribodipyrimidine photo-lyase [Parazoarcus communis]NMG50198.1 deoxyribodipyrimidine photo-lyase [Parazoarcus communis]NMG70725.1 deoxyribodipyrimidine photo-lyase [Parazoarcus communis SWub3 = DSM 12120]PZA15490.1 deoxyribodipyrimidine photo-lyase [Azoarcus communis] [Parazoarcus communis SWub3 = DSM 12120]
MRSALVWFRRDLRNFDHAALHHALRQAERVWCVFIFDRDILDSLPRQDRRVEFIWQAASELDAALDAQSRRVGGQGSGLIVLHDRAVDAIPRLARELGVDQVLANRDYEPAAIERDSRVAQALAEQGIGFADYKDQVIFERDEVLTQGGTPFSVFTPYRNAWMKKLEAFHVLAYPVDKYASRLAPKPAGALVPDLASLGFEPSNLAELKMPTGMSGARQLLEDFRRRIDRYKRSRDFPALKGVSYLSPHLRFGTVSIRELAGLAWQHGGEGAESWLNELVWRDFYHMILWHHPRVVGQAFKPAFDKVRWDDAPALFEAWCAGRTGYPIVDAAMAQLNQTGFMHNRLRMIVASFLTKDLGIDWRLGERYFATHLLDFDLAANNGGWQWAASTGCDAQPWFRIFNPVTQSERFDPDGRFIRRYLPQLARVPDKFIHAPWKMGGIDQSAAQLKIGVDYPAPIVDHAVARERTLNRFGVTKE